MPGLDALVMAAKTAMLEQGPTEALPLWNLIREKFPESSAGHVGYAEALKEAGRLDEADTLLSQSIREFPDDAWGWIHYAQVATRRADWAEALERWQAVRRRFPHLPAGGVGYAEALMGAGRLEEADGLLSESVRKFPDDEWGWIHYARAARPAADWNEPVRRWRDVKSRFPKDAMAALGYEDAVKLSQKIEERSRELLRLLKPNRVEGFQKARFGSAHDGGYVMIDDFSGIVAALSFGIAQDACWDAAVANRGVPVYQFDHTIDEPPIARPDLIFEKSRIVARAQRGARTLDELVSRHGMPWKSSLLLKIDIEGDEWDVFDAASEGALKSFAQIVGEFHFLGNVMVDAPWYEKALRVFTKLSAHFAVVHVHGNNGHGARSAAGITVPHLLEVTLASKHRYAFGPTHEVFPGALDAPNDPNVPDIPLGEFIF